MPPEDLEQLTQQIRDQLEESITEKVTRKMMESFNQMQSQFQSQMQSQGLALPPEPEVAPSGNNPGTGDSEKCGLYIEENPSRLAAVSPAKSLESLDEEVDDPLYLMTLTIPQLFLKPLQSSKRDVYLGAYLNGGHWQMVVILPKENLAVWFCSLHNRPDNYFKGIINSALKGLDDTPQPKSKAAARWIVVKCNKQKGIIECGYYVMYWMSMIILGSFRNNWETYFNEVRPLEAERFKALRIQWAQYYLKVRNQT
ncbi:uncharacterized protein LOC114411218 [Glycine soja]|uniref:uncharacterized protein LOC114411218 n=1 Tax=Glycine soja TaxID=3848 RepID=UPI00103A0D77|nr:uncharacterized protein LOC114411218 [Glycine soja]